MNLQHLFEEEILSVSSVGGGDIGRSSRVKTKRGNFFVKYYAESGVSEAEAAGLTAMAATGAVRVPEVIGFDSHFIVLNYIDSAPRCRGFQARLGRELASMHLASQTDKFGFSQNNYIGSTVQNNSWRNSWLDFLIENRLGYQAELSGDSQLIAAWEKLRPRLAEILEDSTEPACLLHGDLWGGNYISDEEGLPVFIDPAAYYGHREMDLGMTMLFGGFTEEFYTAYADTYPLQQGWRSRMDLYKLYHVLNHFNMFGGGYRSQALSLIMRYL